MKLEQSFDVDAPVDTVWKALIDVERVAPCLPGAVISGNDGEGNYEGTFTVKVGPATASYRGTLHMEEVDEDAHRAVMQAGGTDRRGQGGAKATIVSVVAEAEGGGARVSVDTDYAITGRLARFGRGGMIEDVSKRLLRDFAACLQETLGAEQVPAVAAGGAAGGAGGAAAGTAGGSVPGAPGSSVAGTPGDSVAATPDSARATGAEVGGGAEAARAQRTGAGGGAGAPPAQRPAARPPAQAKPLNALSLLFSVLRDRLKALLARLRRR